MPYNDKLASKFERIKQILSNAAPRDASGANPAIVVNGWFNRVTVVVAADRRDPAA
jgi:hypothetical protein